MEQWRNDTDRVKPKYSKKKCAPVSLFLSQISRGLAWDWTRSSAARRRQLSAWPGKRKKTFDSVEFNAKE